MGRVTHYDTVQMLAHLLSRSGGTWATIADKTRSNTLLSSMAIGDVVDVQVSTAFPALRYRLAHVNYTGGYSTVAEFHEDPSKTYNSIWIPSKLPCLSGSTSAYTRQFDAPELEYAITWDTTFIQNKAYYKQVDAAYVRQAAGTDYTVGASIAEWIAVNGAVYTKNNVQRKNSGSNSWKESNLRQWLNATGSSWYTPRNEYDQIGNDWADGWLTGIDSGLLSVIQRVNNKTARNTLSVALGGAGGGTDTTVDAFWLPGRKEIYGTHGDGIQLEFFGSIATTGELKRQRDEGGTARDVFLRSAGTAYSNLVWPIFASGASGDVTYCNFYNAIMPCFCIA